MRPVNLHNQLSNALVSRLKQALRQRLYSHLSGDIERKLQLAMFYKLRLKLEGEILYNLIDRVQEDLK